MTSYIIPFTDEYGNTKYAAFRNNQEKIFDNRGDAILFRAGVKDLSVD